MGATLGKFFVDVDTLPKTPFGFVQVLFLFFAYGFILFKSSNLISEGSELLLLVPSLAGLVGSVVLPVLGAVPDGAIVLFSGLGDREEAEQQLSVGVGALAGSTIMLLTIPWALSILAGRVNLDGAGEGNYKPREGGKLQPPGNLSLARTGVNVTADIPMGGKIMIGTALAYVVIQVPAFAFACGLKRQDGTCDPEDIKWWAFAGFLVCVVSFVGYLWYNVQHANDSGKQDKVDQVRAAAIASGQVTLAGAFQEALLGAKGESTALLSTSEAEKRLKTTLRTFFARYDVNGDKHIDSSELADLMRDLGEHPTKAELETLMKKMDSSGEGRISFNEFSVGIVAAMQSKDFRRRSTLGTSGIAGAIDQGAAMRAVAAEHEAKGDGDGDDDDVEGGAGAAVSPSAASEDDDSEEEEEVPEDIAALHLSPAEQQKRIKRRAFWMMGVGTAVVLLFSDPMVDVLSEMGTRMDIPAFYVAFVLAPLASNASELIASYAYALKKTKKTISISFAALQGAGCMNNTFCLAIFLLLVFARGFAWEYSAETISIVLVEAVLAVISLKRTQTLRDAVLIAALFPVSIAAVALMEAGKNGLN